MASTNPARGMRDFLPADVRKRNYVINIIKEVYESYGFEPLETPAVENIETLMGKYGDEGNQLIFEILKRGAKRPKLVTVTGAKNVADLTASYAEAYSLSDLALRYDLTVPLARVVANNKNELPKFFKRYQIQPVWRADRPARGRFREFYQCDVDAIGSQSMVVETEIISAAGTILLELGKRSLNKNFDDFVVRINHRQILARMLAVAGLPTTLSDSALVALDKLDKIGKSGVELEFAERNILQSPEVQAVRKELIEVFMTAFDIMRQPDVVARGFLRNSDIEEINISGLERIGAYLAGDEIGTNALNEVREILSLTGPRVGFDPSLARGLSYYTGAIMEINVPDLAGSLGGGGRYDGLIGMFGKEQIPACGFSLGLERILVVMEERGMFPSEIAESTPADVMVRIGSEDSIADSLKLASELRTIGLRVTVYPQPDKEDKQWKYANSIGVPWLCSPTASDIADKTVSYQNLKTREKGQSSCESFAKLVLSTAN